MLAVFVLLASIDSFSTLVPSFLFSSLFLIFVPRVLLGNDMPAQLVAKLVAGTMILCLFSGTAVFLTLMLFLSLKSLGSVLAENTVPDFLNVSSSAILSGNVLIAGMFACGFSGASVSLSQFIGGGRNRSIPVRFLWKPLDILIKKLSGLSVGIAAYTLISLFFLTAAPDTPEAGVPNEETIDGFMVFLLIAGSTIALVISSVCCLALWLGIIPSRICFVGRFLWHVFSKPV